VLTPKKKNKFEELNDVIIDNNINMLGKMSDFHKSVADCQKECQEILERCRTTESKINTQAWTHDKMDIKFANLEEHIRKIQD